MNRRAREEEIINANNPIDKYKWIGDPSASDVSNGTDYSVDPGRSTASPPGDS